MYGWTGSGSVQQLLDGGWNVRTQVTPEDAHRSRKPIPVHLPRPATLQQTNRSVSLSMNALRSLFRSRTASSPESIAMASSFVKSTVAANKVWHCGGDGRDRHTAASPLVRGQPRALRACAHPGALALHSRLQVVVFSKTYCPYCTKVKNGWR